MDEVSSWNINDLENFLKEKNVSPEIIKTITNWAEAFYDKIWNDGYNEGWFDSSK